MKIVKALDDMKLEILAIPFGGPDDLDSDGEYFNAKTRIHADKFPEIPLVYYHGYDPDGKPSEEPHYIGTAKYSRTDEKGHWYIGVLDSASEWAKRAWQAAKEQILRASSGSIAHLVRMAGRWIKEWPVAEVSLIDANGKRQPANQRAVALPVMKAVYEQAGLALPDGLEAEPEASVRDAAAEAEDSTPKPTKRKEVKTMETNEISPEVQAQLKRLADLEKAEAERIEKEKIEAAAADAVKAARESWEKERETEAAKAGRLPEVPENVTTAKFANLWKYDNLSPEDHAVMVGVLLSAASDPRHKGGGASEDALKALAIKMEEDKGDFGKFGRNALKAAGIKANEIMQFDLANYGDDWVGVAYSNAIWESIRQEAFVVDKLPKIEVPQGNESYVVPLESGDPTFYKVAEAATTATTTGWPNATITSSQAGSAKVTLSLSKMGARVLWSGELAERSLIPVAEQLRMQLVKAGAEQFEHAIIDGDSTTTGSTNINDIAGTPAGTELFLMFNGFRKSGLVTTTANSRSGGALTVEDYLETMKMLGVAGKNADVRKCAFIVDPNTYWKSFELDEVKTRDVFSAPVIENGRLTGLYGYPLYPSWNMHYKSAARKANTAGKVDQDVVGNNTTGSILAVRWDQWMLGYQRRMTLETTRIARADTYEIVAMMVAGLAQRDTEAAAITYNLTV